MHNAPLLGRRSYRGPRHCCCCCCYLYSWVTVNVKRSVVTLFPLRAPQAQKPPTDSGLYDTKDLGAFVPGTCKSIQTVRVIPYALSERESRSRYNATVTAKVFEETVALYAARERQQRCNLGRISERPVFELRGHVVIVFNAVIVVKCCAVGAG